MQSLSEKRIGVLIAQLGTPDEPTPPALRRYLKQFLSDRRVIDYSPLLWQPILQGIILRKRPARSAQLYQRIWLEEGSPLLIYSQRQVTGLQERLGQNYRVILGMTYGNPSIQSAIEQLENEGIDQILVFSMFPQYSSTTTASIYDAVYKSAGGPPSGLLGKGKRLVPTLRFVGPYYQDAGYIEAMKTRCQATLQEWGKQPDLILFSFHGIPNRYITTGDPYRRQCEETAQLLAEAMDLKTSEWSVSFQSQFGPEKWLEPYTEEVLTGLHQKGIESVLVVCPGFTADCLETLDELGNEGQHQFVEGGGKAENYRLVPCLNDFPDWLDGMAQIIERESLGWVELPEKELLNSVK